MRKETESQKLFKAWVDSIVKRTINDKPKNPEACHKLFNECEAYFKGR